MDLIIITAFYFRFVLSEAFEVERDYPTNRDKFPSFNKRIPLSLRREWNNPG